MTMPRAKVTDELLDAYVHRPLARRIVDRVVDTRCTPNHLTLVSAIFGTLAGVGFASTSPFATIGGALSLFLCMVFDCTDGQLARARGGGSVFGRIADGYADYWVALAVHYGILLHLGRTGVVFRGHALDLPERILFVLVAGVSMALNAGRFDHYKMRWLAYTGAVTEPERPELFLEEAKKSRSIVERAALKLFAAYVRVGMGSAHVELVAAARATASDPVRRARYQQENARLMRLWSLIGPTLHLAAICVAACLAPWVPQAFVAYCLFAIIVSNAYAFVLWILQRRVLRREGEADREVTSGLCPEPRSNSA